MNKYIYWLLSLAKCIQQGVKLDTLLIPTTTVPHQSYLSQHCAFADMQIVLFDNGAIIKIKRAFNYGFFVGELKILQMWCR